MTDLSTAGVREFAYGGSRFAFDTHSLRFRPLDRANAGLDGLYARLASRPRRSEAPARGGVNFVTLNVAHDCNMACPYCFAKQGLYGGVARQLMDEATACASVDWLFQQSGDKPEVYLRFLGGEPFMNVPVMAAAAAYAEERGRQTGKDVYLSVNTNGTIFTEDVKRLLHEHPMTVSISMDGTREAHDTFRVFRNGAGTYDRVVANLPKFLAVDPHTMINATLTAENLDVDEYADLFVSLGIRLVRFAMVGTSIPEIAVAKEEKLEQVLAAYDRLAERYRRDLLAGDVWYLADFYKYLGNLRELQPRFNRCGAGTTYVNVDVKGTVNLCHRFTTDETQQVGSVGGDMTVPVAITRRRQLDPTSASVPSGPEVSKLTGQPGVRRRNLLADPPPSGHRVPAHLHRQLDGTPFFDQTASTAGRHLQNVCAVCDIRHVCGGSCFHDGEILYGDLFGGPDGFKCEVDRHLAKITMWLLDAVLEQRPQVLDALDALHLRSQQHHAD